jgi:ATP-dependent RNA helicase DeaD
MSKNQFIVRPNTQKPTGSEKNSQKNSPQNSPQNSSKPNHAPAKKSFSEKSPSERPRFEKPRAEKNNSEKPRSEKSAANHSVSEGSPGNGNEVRYGNASRPSTRGRPQRGGGNAQTPPSDQRGPRYPSRPAAPINQALMAKPMPSAHVMSKSAAAPVSISNTTGVKFQDFNIPPLLLKSVLAMKYEAPSPIQAQTIPPALEGKDILGSAQTGTGKTAAFLIPLVAKLLKNQMDVAVVLAPTRELAHQIEAVLKDLTENTKHLGHALLIGGMSMDPQMRALRKNPRVIIATPGRLLDHMSRRSVNLVRTSFLVLDEADRMLDMGFAPQLRDILKVIPKQRQTLLFTATLPPPMRVLAQKYLMNPVEVTIGATSKPVERIEQSSVKTSTKDKNDALLEALNARPGSVIIFARTQRRADRLHKHLLAYGHHAGVIHGGKSQGQRNRALLEFRNSETRILVATDVASRGIDIPHVAHVINYDLPEQAEDYVHRIGRTARAGNEGSALSLVTPEEQHLWKKIQQL